MCLQDLPRLSSFMGAGDWDATEDEIARFTQDLECLHCGKVPL